MSISRMGVAFFVLLFAALQACESNVCEAGPLWVSLVAVAVVLPATAILWPISSRFVRGSGVLSLILLAVVEVVAPVPTIALLSIGPMVVVGLLVAHHLED